MKKLILMATALGLGLSFTSQTANAGWLQIVAGGGNKPVATAVGRAALFGNPITGGLGVFFAGAKTASPRQDAPPPVAAPAIDHTHGDRSTEKVRGGWSGPDRGSEKSSRTT